MTPSTAAVRTPELSVVVIVFAGGNRLARCLDALVAQRGAPAPEIIVPHDASLPTSAALAAKYPGVRFVAHDGRRPPAELRARGVLAARGDVIALLEDHCLPDADWAARVLAAHVSSHAAIGGAIDKGFAPGRGDDSALNWALYIADYARYMPPFTAAPAQSVSDCNASYKRAALEPVRASWSVEFHENVVNDALRERGGTLWLDPAIVVRQQRTLTWSAALRDRYTFGRLFGATRVTGVSLPKRLVLSAAVFALPPLLVWRSARNVLSKRLHRAQLLRALPALWLISGAWAAGEMVGYLLGSAGAALRPAETAGRGVVPDGAT